ncbi:MAG TPA: YdcH family protein [Burkholderiaceae bacterium]|nr:YdcH family protein [Burkholderiaceae bacterium]
MSAEEDQQNDQIKRRIIELQVEHRDLDAAIEQLSRRNDHESNMGMDDIGLRRLKKRKLMIKDTLARLQMRLVPDIPA